MLCWKFGLRCKLSGYENRLNSSSQVPTSITLYKIVNGKFGDILQDRICIMESTCTVRRLQLFVTKALSQKYNVTAKNPVYRMCSVDHKQNCYNHENLPALKRNTKFNYFHVSFCKTTCLVFQCCVQSSLECGFIDVLLFIVHKQRCYFVFCNQYHLN